MRDMFTVTQVRASHFSGSRFVGLQGSKPCIRKPKLPDGLPHRTYVHPYLRMIQFDEHMFEMV